MTNPGGTAQDILLGSRSVAQLAASAVGQGVKLSLWRNVGRDIEYIDPKGHTISLYLKGGNRSFRKCQAGALQGGEDKICLIPEGTQSRWGHNDKIEFLHVHVDDTELKRRFTEMTGRDCRTFALPEITYGDQQILKHALRAVYGAWREDNALHQEESVTELLAEMVSISDHKSRRLTGGMSSFAQRHLRDYVEAHLGEKLSLREMARTANLSEFHFQRMFAATFGVSPARWVNHRRISRGKSLLSSGMSIAQVAAHCGFTDQSHFSRAFKRQVGVTPGSYCKSIAAQRASC